MNLELLLKLFVDNAHKIKNKKPFFLFFQNEYDILRIKKEKLKLGKVIFEIKDHYFDEFLIYEELEMIHCRQDNTEANERKFETRLETYKWKWDFNNVGAAIIMATIIYHLLEAYFKILYFRYFPAFAYKQPEFNSLIKFNFYCIVQDQKISKISVFDYANHTLFSTISDTLIELNYF